MICSPDHSDPNVFLASALASDVLESVGNSMNSKGSMTLSEHPALESGMGHTNTGPFGTGNKGVP